MACFVEGRRIVKEYDKKMTESKDFSLASEANQKICDMAKEQTTKTLNAVVHESSMSMRNGYNRADN